MDELNGKVAMGPKHKTECWQPIDNWHVGMCVKEQARKHLECWFDAPSAKEGYGTNWDAWEHWKLSASEQRVLCTWLYGRAWDTVSSPAFQHFREAAFLHCGFLMTLSGHNDGCVFIPGSTQKFIMLDPDTAFTDQKYMDECYSGSLNFVPSVAPKDAPDEKDEE